MSLSKNSNEQEPNEEANKNLNITSANEADLDNDTYGHSPDTSAFKRKNEPQEEHNRQLEGDSGVDSSEKLKNINLSDADLSDSSGDTEKGIGGKQL